MNVGVCVDDNSSHDFSENLLKNDDNNNVPDEVKQHRIQLHEKICMIYQPIHLNLEAKGQHYPIILHK